MVRIGADANFPNRAFANAGTSLGVLKDHDGQVFNCPSIFGKLSDANLDWAIYGYNAPPLTRTDLSRHPDCRSVSILESFADFQEESLRRPATCRLTHFWNRVGARTETASTPTTMSRWANN